MSDTRLVVPGLLLGKSLFLQVILLVRLLLGCGISLHFGGDFALWEIIRQLLRKYSYDASEKAWFKLIVSSRRSLET